MKRKIKKKNRQKKRKQLKKNKFKAKKNKKIVFKRKRKTKRKKIRKIKQKILSKINIPTFSNQRKKIVKLNFQKIINFILQPIFKAYDDYREKRRIEKLRKIAIEKKEKEKQIKEEKRLRLEAKQKELRDEIKLAKERSLDLKKFIRQEQAILRREQAEKRLRFLEEIKLEKKIESFRKRELQEIKNLEKLALKEQRDDYRPVEERLEKIKEKYRLIREQKIRERVQSLGVEISDEDTKEDLIKKEREYAEHRLKIELVLESFYRSANSLVFQLNKRYIPKHKSILRVIDRRYESNECFIRYDDSPDEDWLILIYLEDSDAKKGKIVVENKANPEKHETKSFETKEIFTYSDYLVDAMTAHIDRERQKKAS
tara:strand:+ start:540 stop:1652 length:1113 start_codon:yes stop_codon:yes gene_type:complete